MTTSRFIPAGQILLRIGPYALLLPRRSLLLGSVLTLLLAIASLLALGVGTLWLTPEQIWNGLLQNPPKATNDFNEVVTSKNDMKYYVSVDGSGNDSVCRYYLVNALSKTADGGYEDPNNQTNKFKSFSYRPASGQVETHINN